MTKAKTAPKTVLPAPAAEDDQILTTTAVSDLLAKAGRRKIRELVTRGEFHSYAFDGKTVYSKNEVLAFLERLKAKGAGRAAWRGRVAPASSTR